MQKGEVEAINNSDPFMPTVLRMIGNGKEIGMGSPFFQTYMVARQRGFVKRIGETKEQIVVSERGELFLEMREALIGADNKYDEFD